MGKLHEKSEQKRKAEGWKNRDALDGILDPLPFDTPQSALSLPPTWGYSPSCVYTSLSWVFVICNQSILSDTTASHFILFIRFHGLFLLLLWHPRAPAGPVICTEWTMDGHPLFMKGSRQVVFSEMEGLLLRLPDKVEDAQLNVNFR